MSKLGRNDPCHCGSGKKYKQCCLAKDEAKERKAREKAAAKAEKEAPAEAAAPDAKRRAAPPPAAHPARGRANTHGFQRVNAIRKVGG
jgi:hypothetical protein